MPKDYLFTFGYEGIDIESYVAKLEAVGIQRVVDVRELPLSRKKGFSKSAFRQRLEAANIDYVHEPKLGCPKSIRNRYREDGDWKIYTRDFLQHLDKQQSVVCDLAAAAKLKATCLICFEADYSTCHRTYVARAANRFGAPPVKHLGVKTDQLDFPSRLAA